MATNPALGRTIDTLQRLYAVIAGLAIGQALNKSFLKGSNSTLSVHLGDLQVPLAIACVVTIIPFVHGMNRHLDKHVARLKEGPDKNWMMMLLSLDFLVFVIECCVLLMLGASVGEVTPGSSGEPNTRFLTILGAVLLIDVVWSSLSQLLEKGTYTWEWLPVNVLTIAVLWAVSQFSMPELQFFWLIAAIATVRSGLDYWINLYGYFPLTPDATD